MKVADLLRQRRQNWQELEHLCSQLENRRKSTLGANQISHFTSLYRAACADLALADAYQLPPSTVQYLHRLVGRAHNQLYRTPSFDFGSWGRILFQDVPRKIFRDPCVQVCFLLFWGMFIAAAYLAASPDRWPGFAEAMVGEEQLDQLETSFSDPIAGRNSQMNPIMASFYIQHNTGIGLQCFAGGLLVIVGLLITIFNAASLGAMFGYMARADVPEGENFFHFVTAHGPFELTAIVLSAAAGLKLGLAWVRTLGWSRSSSLKRTAQEAMPLMGAAMLMFFFAALIEGFLSPSAAPYAVKATVAAVTSGLLMFYFVVLGFPQGADDAT